MLISLVRGKSEKPIPDSRLPILIYCSFDFIKAVMFRESGNKLKNIDRGCAHGACLLGVNLLS